MRPRPRRRGSRRRRRARWDSDVSTISPPTPLGQSATPVLLASAPMHLPRYLLVNHIPLGRGATPGTVTIGDMWLEDLRAQSRAIADAGMKLVVATPLVDKLDLQASGSFNAVEIRTEDHGFEHEPLPFYVTMPQFL